MAGPDRLLHNERLVFRLDEPQTQIRQILADREGNLWIATLREGLHRLRPSLFTTYGVPEGLASANVYAVREAPAGTMWIGTMGGGLVRLRQDGVRIWRRPDGAPSPLIRETQYPRRSARPRDRSARGRTTRAAPDRSPRRPRSVPAG